MSSNEESSFRERAPPPIRTQGNGERKPNEEIYKMEKLALTGDPPPPPPPKKSPRAKPSPENPVPRATEQKESRGDSDEEDSLLDIEQLEELHNEAERMKALGNKHMAAQEYTRAYNAYSAALQLSPVGPSSHVFLSNRAAALLSLKRYAAAATDARRAVALAPTFGKAHARLGQSLYFLKDYEGAVAAYEEAIRYEPDNKVTETYLEKAKIKLTKQREKAAREARGEEVTVEDATVADTIVNSIATDPNASAAVVTSGFRGSSDAIMAAVGSHPSEISTKDHKSPRVQEEQDVEEEFDDGDPDFEEAVIIQERANKFLANKQYKRAIEEYSAALFLVPDDPYLSPELHLGRAHALNGVRRHESARNDAQLALKWIATAEAYSTLAKSLFYMKEYRGSIDAFRNCMEVLPEGESLSMFDRLYLEKAQAALNEELDRDPEADARSTQSTIPKLPPPRFVPREQAISATQNMPPAPKKWPQQSPRAASALQCGPEREVTFISESLGIKLNRGTDGIVRVISVAPETPGSPLARNGRIEVGDVVREAAGVDIRRPITNIMWGDTVALIKLAPRPITFVVAKELSTPPPTVLEEQEKAESEVVIVSQGSPAAISTQRGEQKKEEEEIAYIVPSPANGEESVRDSIAASNERRLEALTDEKEASRLRGGGEETTLYDDTVDFDCDVATATEAKGNETEEDPAAERNEDNVEQADSPVPPELIASVSEEEGRSKDPDTPGINEGDDESEKPPADVDLATSGQDEEVDEKEIPPADQEEKAESFEVVETPTLPKDEPDSLAAEVIFEQSATAPADGWTNTRWLSTSGVRKLRHCGSVHRLVNRRNGFFWSGEQYVPRKLALFDYPNLILILRAPKNVCEIRDLLGLPDGVDIAADGTNTALESFLVAESVVDPKACKLRLSPLTTVTSVESSETSEKRTPRRQSCFELVTPTERIVLSAVCARDVKKQDAFTDSVAVLETSLLEVAVGNALSAAHTPVDEEELPPDAAWKHQIILGTLHSFVISGNQKMLESAIQGALIPKTTDDGGVSPPRVVQSRIIDAKDESGRTALHYACSRRSHSAVSLLVNAGADVSIPTRQDSMQPCHLSAQNLDEKSLSTILSASKPSRPDPNALDELGRTPMYVAVVEGRTVGGGRDPEALGHCLSALEAWGGQMLLDGQSLSRPLRHPVSIVASEWRSQELAEILPHVPYRYPFQDGARGSRTGISLDAAFHYPVHSALLSLRKQVDHVRQGESNEVDVEDNLMPESKLVSTLRILLEHGFEPNERLHGVADEFDGAEELTAFIGYSPLQILAIAALDASTMTEEADQEEPGDSSAVQRILEVIVETAIFLVQNGARLNLDQPLCARVTTRSSSSLSERTSSQDSVEEGSNTDSPPDSHRPAFQMDTSKVFVKLFGREDELKSAKKQWSEVKSTAATQELRIHDKAKSQLPDSDAPGGSDEKSCAICWKEFGSIRNRKHTCRVTNRYVCEECSTKRVVRDGQEYRVSDGQFLVARVDAAKQQAERFEEEREEERIRKLRVDQVLSERRSQLAKAEEEDRDTLFGGVMEKAANYVFGENEEESAQAQVSGLSESLGQARDALNERGDRLNTISEKTARLKDASRDFARMAKELERNQRGFW